MHQYDTCSSSVVEVGEESPDMLMIHMLHPLQVGSLMICHCPFCIRISENMISSVHKFPGHSDVQSLRSS